FSYTVSDGQQGTEAAEVAATVIAVNDPPRAEPDTAAGAQGLSGAPDVPATDSAGPADEADQMLGVLALGLPSHGTATLILSGADAGRVRYVPSPGYAGPDSFTYDVSDGELTGARHVSS